MIAVTHDRYFLDNVAGWILELDRGRGLPFQGNYSSWLEQKQARLAVEEKQESARRRTLARELEWVRHEPARTPCEVEGPPRRLREALGRGGAREARPGRDPHPARPPARGARDRGRGARQGLRRPAPVRGSHLLAPAGGDRRRHRPERGRQDDALSPDRRRGTAGRRLAPPRRHGRAGLRRPVPWRARPEEHGLEGDQRRPGPDRARQARGQLAPVRELVQLPWRGPAEAGRTALRRRAQPRPPREAAPERRQRAPPRRADERPRRRHAAGARGGAARLRRLRRRDHARPLVPRPRRHPHPRLRGRLAGDVVRGKLGRVRRLGDRETRGAEALEPHRIKYKPLVRS